ncbi:hypothetical protein [Streptomyces sp. AC495_CC817]|uniref:hypothetical protein n=1 Tax=Streptomyces sp. AC495_CC817 TaxID=2823900 RepID=UPI001C273919|nr:hypothetical protein [Streptomyces sp. AC495_CC817]
MTSPALRITRSIVVTPHDQVAVRHAVSAAALSRRLVLTGAIVLPIALVLAVLAVAGGDPLAFLLLGVVLALSVLFLVLVVVARIVSGRGAARAFPVGSEVGIAVDDDGIGITGPTSSARVEWSAVAEVARVGGALRLSGVDRSPALFLPGRLLDDAHLAAIAVRIG